MSKTAIVSGITSQDARYLVPILLEQNYTVYGLIRRSASSNVEFLREEPFNKVKIIEWDILDNNSVYEIISKIKPDEFYNLAAMSNIGTSFHQPEYTIQVNGVGVVKILENIRLHSPHTKFLQCGTSAQFAGNPETVRDETTTFAPNSPYGISKCLAHNTVTYYRDVHKLFASNVIMENHDSIYRNHNFLSRKVTDYVAQYYLGLTKEPLQLGNLDICKDWGHAKDFARAMYITLQKDRPADYCVGTKTLTSIRKLVEKAFGSINISIKWEGAGLNEVGIDESNNKILITISKDFYRPNECKSACTDYRVFRKETGWEPTVTFDDLIKEMVGNDIKVLKNKCNNIYVHT